MLGSESRQGNLAKAGPNGLLDLRLVGPEGGGREVVALALFEPLVK